MKSFRFVHAADLHLDSPFVGLSALPDPVRRIVRDSTLDALDQLVSLVVREKADFLLVAGDVYDASDRSLRGQLRFREAMLELDKQGICVFIVHGNHDPEDGVKASLSWPGNVFFYPSGEVAVRPAYSRRTGAAVADIYGISYPTAAVRDNLALRFRREREDRYAIGLLHANVDGNGLHEPYAPCSRQDLNRAGMDYWALGHVHTRAVLQEQPWIVYPGNIQGRSIRECGPRGCYVVDVDETGRAELKFEALDAVRWMQADVPISGMQTVQELQDAMARCMDGARLKAEGRPGLLRIRLTGRGALHGFVSRPLQLQELAEALHREELSRAEAGGAFLWLESCRADTGSELADPGELRQQDDFLGELLRLAERMRQDGAWAEEVLDAALRPLLSHPLASRHAPRPGDDEELELWLSMAEEWAIEYLHGKSG